MSYFETVKPTYIENWPAEMAELSIPQTSIKLSVDDARNVGSNIADLGVMFAAKPADIRPLEYHAAQILENNYPKGAYVRLGSRGPKDIGNNLKVTVNDNPFRYLLSASERIADDLYLAIQNEYSPHLFIRKWQDIEPWAEFRCFMRNRKLEGVSQYHYFDGSYKEICDNHRNIAATISRFFDKFSTISHLDDVVCDVFLKNEEVRLLDLNPYTNITDPCLFEWAASFDRTFRYISHYTGSVTHARL